MTMASERVNGSISAGAAIAMGGTGASVAATGSVVGDAAAINASIVIATGADATKGVLLPAAQPGDTVWMFNNSASDLVVYPNTGAAICLTGTGLGTANTAYTHTAHKTVLYKMQSSTQWFVKVT